MAHQEPLRITCDDCPGCPGCDDCLVGFFLRGRDAEVVRLGGEATPPSSLDADLAAAFDALVQAGLRPEILATRRSVVPRAS